MASAMPGPPRQGDAQARDKRADPHHAARVIAGLEAIADHAHDEHHSGKGGIGQGRGTIAGTDMVFHVNAAPVRHRAFDDGAAEGDHAQHHQVPVRQREQLARGIVLGAVVWQRLIARVERIEEQRGHQQEVPDGRHAHARHGTGGQRTGEGAHAEPAVQHGHDGPSGVAFGLCAQRIDGHVEAAGSRPVDRADQHERGHVRCQPQQGQRYQQGQSGVERAVARAVVAGDPGRQREGADRADAATQQHQRQRGRIELQVVPDGRNAGRPVENTMPSSRKNSGMANLRQIRRRAEDGREVDSLVVIDQSGM
jgi:hypothetical protein